MKSSSEIDSGGPTPINRSSRGFTLVEILVVLAVLAIIAAAAIPLITSQKDRGHKKEAIDQLSATRDALYVYHETVVGAAGSYSGATLTNIGFSPGTVTGGQISHFTYGMPAIGAGVQTFTVTATGSTNAGTYSNSTVTITEAGAIGGSFP